MKTATEIIAKYLKSMTPTGTRIMINDSHFLDVKLTCDGAIMDMGYLCCLEPGHMGKCWSLHKKVDFEREK